MSNPRLSHTFPRSLNHCPTFQMFPTRVTSITSHRFIRMRAKYVHDARRYCCARLASPEKRAASSEAMWPRMRKMLWIMPCNVPLTKLAKNSPQLHIQLRLSQLSTFCNALTGMVKTRINAAAHNAARPERRKRVSSSMIRFFHCRSVAPGHGAARHAGPCARSIADAVAAARRLLKMTTALEVGSRLSTAAYSRSMASSIAWTRCSSCRTCRRRAPLMSWQQHTHEQHSTRQSHPQRWQHSAEEERAALLSSERPRPPKTLVVSGGGSAAGAAVGSAGTALLVLRIAPSSTSM
mmetsp:Transcript_5027/g.20009  ORF Transcript_5027/g.20009 Transcript_5027/m.20009 type:complete len:294 (-) Transcript_5027:1807-2688(-)